MLLASYDSMCLERVSARDIQVKLAGSQTNIFLVNIQLDENKIAFIFVQEML